MPEERVFLNENNLYVSNTKVILRGTTYATANITSVAKRFTPASKGCAVLLILFGVGALISAFAAMTSVGGGDGGGVVVMGVAALAAGVFWLQSLKPTFHVFVASASAEREGLSSKDESLVDRITTAINDAITYRG